MADDIDDHIAAVEQDQGLPSGFFRSLLDQDDWSFVVKLHALFESVATRMLTVCLRDNRLSDVFARIELGGKGSGKLAFAKALALCSQEERSFIANLGELRNDLVHNAKLVGFTFDEHIKGLDTNQRKRFVEVFGRNIAEMVQIAEKKVDRSQFILENAKLSTWVTGMFCIGSMYLSEQFAITSKESEQTKIQLAEAHLEVLKATMEQATTLGKLGGLLGRDLTIKP